MTQANHLSADDSSLWSSLKDFTVGEVDIDLTYLKRLARENRWSATYARRVFEEYKKFIYLAVVSGHRITPSDQVDQAWHLHLVYTESYWNDLCGEILKRPLHHGPTKGGRMEDDKFNGWYARTLESYERIFGHEPPADIWPSPAERFNPKIRFNRLDTAGYWLIKRPATSISRSVLAALVLILSSGFIVACRSEGVGGSAVVVAIFAAVLLILGISAAIGSRKRGSREGSSSSDGGDGCSAHVDSGDSGCGSDGGGSDGGGSSGCGSSGCGGGGCGS